MEVGDVVIVEGVRRNGETFGPYRGVIEDWYNTITVFVRGPVDRDNPEGRWSGRRMVALRNVRPAGEPTTKREVMEVGRVRARGVTEAEPVKVAAFKYWWASELKRVESEIKEKTFW